MASRLSEEGDSFGRYVRRLRAERGWTQRGLAERLGIDFTYLSKIENDRGEPPAEPTVRRMAEALGADVEELLALAVKLPAGLRERASQDLRFARLLRRLPETSDEELQRVYRQLGIDQRKP